MKVKALTGFETAKHIPEEDDAGNFTIRVVPISMKEGEVADIDDKLARRLLDYGHVSEDLNAETNLDRVRREASQQ
jgi:precorrin-6x reductase